MSDDWGNDPLQSNAGDDWGNDPLQPTQSAVKTEQSPGLLKSLASGFGRGIVGTAGIINQAVNPVANVENFVNDTGKFLFGKSSDVIPQQNIPGSAAQIDTVLGNVGLNPEDVHPQNWQERIAQMAGQGLSAVAFPAEGILGVMANAGTGLMSGIGAGVVSEAVSPKYKPVAQLAGSLLGGIGTAAAIGVPKALAQKILTPEPGAAGRLADFTAEGIPPLASPISGSREIGYLESTLSKTPGGARIYQDAQQASLDALQKRLGDIAEGFGPQGTPEQTGTLIRKGLQSASERFKSRQSQLYDSALAPVLEQPIAGRSLPNLENLSADFTKELDATPESSAKTAGVALQRVNALLRDVSRGDATIDALRKVRTGIGREINDPILAGVSGAQQPYLKRTYSALSDDINGIAQDMDPTGTVAQGLDVANRYTRQNAHRLDFLQDFLGSKQDAQIYNAAVSSAKGGGQVLSAIRKTVTPDQWGQIAGTVLGRMGRAIASNQTASGIADEGSAFSPSTFLTNWENMRPEAKTALFGGTRYQSLIPSLDRLVRVSEGMRDFQKLGVGSPSFSRIAHGTLIGGMAASAAENLMSGQPLRAITDPVAIFAGAYVVPRLMAKYMTNPKFINLLANRAAAKTPAMSQAAERALRAFIAINAPQSTQAQQ